MTASQRIGNRRRQARYAQKMKALVAQVTEAPWTTEKRLKMQADPGTWPLIWILIDREEAKVLQGGDVPETVAVQVDRALAE